jgi:hypothetical protein
MSPANNKPESDEFDEEDATEAADVADDLDADLIKDLESLRRRGPKIPDPAWRRLERYREERRTAEELTDFKDYDIGDDHGAGVARAAGPKRKKKKKR